jgi:hypothetical protein
MQNIDSQSIAYIAIPVPKYFGQAKTGVNQKGYY